MNLNILDFAYSQNPNNIIYSLCASLNSLSFQVVQKEMDPREVIILSSDDEMSVEPYRTPSDESNGRSRAFSGPVEMSLDPDDLHGGMDLSFRILFIFISCLL